MQPLYEERPSEYANPNETPYINLMSRRIREVLLVCSSYDRFMLEEDGRIDEQLFEEYVSLKLRYPPQFGQASTVKEAMTKLSQKSYDLVIVMLSVGEATALETAEAIKNLYPDKPVVLLTPLSSKETRRVLRLKEDSPLDLIFHWQGNTNVMLAIIKLLEDRMNLEPDVSEYDVQCIILVEDSVQYYSSYLPTIYETLIRQARNAMREGLNEWEKTIRMRSRPKILLAKSYEQARDLYERFKGKILGVITDVTYQKEGEINETAGIELCRHIRSEDKELPVLLQSSNPAHRSEALSQGAGFIHKQADTLLRDLETYIRFNYGFGDFVFLEPETGTPLGRAADLNALHKGLLSISDHVFEFHVRRNDFSRWLRARSLFSLAKKIRAANESDFDSLLSLKNFLIDSIHDFRKNRGRGVIAEFDNQRFDEVTFFSRIGSGSLGGKGRGLAFIDQELKRNRINSKFPGVTINVPRTIILTTKVFDEFMAFNDLQKVAFEGDDKEIIAAFDKARFPQRYLDDMKAVLEEICVPLAVRSSSLLEDSQHEPFAGIYQTYMIPNNAEAFSVRMEELLTAVKGVYASTYYNQSKAYMKSTGNRMEDEKMGVIIQEITGRKFGELFYPQVSGVARSLNYYPIEPEKSEDGIAEIAFGLGKTVVDGETSLRFSPAFPRKVMQLSNPDTAMYTTQNHFYALDLRLSHFGLDEKSHRKLLHLGIKEVEDNGSLKHVASTYDLQDNRIRDGISRKGMRLITMAGVLKYGFVPLPEILSSLLYMGSCAMNVPVEIEFALDWDSEKTGNIEFSFLQIRPIAETKTNFDVAIEQVDVDNALLYAKKAMGNGVYDDIQDIVYIRPETFDRSKMEEMGSRLGRINKSMIDEGRGYLLIVPGRLGSADPWLGIPLYWPDISGARVIVETGSKKFLVEPSQGTHFFQNITSLGCGYLTINPDIGDGIFREESLKEREAVLEDKYFRVMHFDSPLDIRINGKEGKAVVLIEES